MFESWFADAPGRPILWRAGELAALVSVAEELVAIEQLSPGMA